MSYKGKEINLILQGNEIDVIDNLLLSLHTKINRESWSCLHNIRSQITDALEEEARKRKEQS